MGWLPETWNPALRVPRQHLLQPSSSTAGFENQDAHLVWVILEACSSQQPQRIVHLLPARGEGLLSHCTVLYYTICYYWTSRHRLCVYNVQRGPQEVGDAFVSEDVEIRRPLGAVFGLSKVNFNVVGID